MICDKCKKNIDSKWESGITYEGIDFHHNPPQFLMKDWKGDLLTLCRNCHTGSNGIHNKILILMNKKANTLKFNGSEHWLLQKMCQKDIDELANEVFEFTNNWLNKEVECDGN